MEHTFILFAAAVALTLVFDYINGFHDAANAIATVVSTRVLSPSKAVAAGAILNLAGAMMGTEVAATVGKGLVEASSISIHTILCTVVSAIIWNIITWWRGLPTSSSHALIGALLGATYASGGTRNIFWAKVGEKVIAPMFSSPAFGVVVGFLFMLSLLWIFRRMQLSAVNGLFGKLQLLSAGFMAFEHGRNDAQKSMGVIALAIVLAYPQQGFEVPFWVKLSCATVMGLGTMAGGWRIIHTLGSKVIKLQPIHGFAAEMSASAILAAASHYGLPVSTTHVISTSIMGVGATRGFSAVRWGIVGRIVWAWVLTIPLTFALAYGLTALYQLL
jgi:PiT family inorganic phosphate transporter